MSDTRMGRTCHPAPGPSGRRSLAFRFARRTMPESPRAHQELAFRLNSIGRTSVANGILSTRLAVARTSQPRMRRVQNQQFYATRYHRQPGIPPG